MKYDDIIKPIIGPRKTAYPERTARNVVAVLRRYQGLQAIDRRAVRYAPLLILIQRGNVAAKSKPPDSAFPGTLMPS